jgi:thiol:disulfide interchange protein DsbC
MWPQNDQPSGKRLMNQSIFARLASLALLCCSSQVIADTAESLSAVRSNIEKSLPDLTITSLAETPVPGLFELVMDGQIYYVNEGGDYLLDGNLIELSTRTNLTENRIGGIHMELVEALGEENMLVYEPDEPSERSITIFTDLSCPYCQKLHEEIDVLLDAGVRVRYLLFPRAGLGSQAHADLESVWCADDPQKAMTVAKSGGKVEPSTCDNPIESHVTLAEQVGLRGTPLIYLDTGQRVSGYREATILADMINTSEKLNTTN